MFGILLAAFVATASHACPQFFVGGMIPLTPAATQLCFDGYSLGHSAIAREPVWSAEHLTADGVKLALATKRAGTFHSEALLPRSDRSELKDYLCAPYDRGHMTPVGDFGEVGQEGDTFTLANMVPQVPALNEGLWAGIEGAVRDLALRDGELYVVTGPLPGCEASPADGTCEPALLNGRVEIPAVTWKAVYDPKTGAAFAYVAANDASGAFYVETIAALAHQLGFDPMPGLSDAVKAVVPSGAAPKPLKGDAKLPTRACH